MENKVLCCCHNVTINDVQKNIEQGVVEFSQLQEKTGIGTDCQPCKESNKKIFEQLLNENRKS